uniref:Uncharacterized protein n=1 Tax=Plectus sambesii TaxID=2011161 RepID=A0A914WMT2_9BILA
MEDREREIESSQRRAVARFTVNGRTPPQSVAPIFGASTVSPTILARFFVYTRMKIAAEAKCRSRPIRDAGRTEASLSADRLTRRSFEARDTSGASAPAVVIVFVNRARAAAVAHGL